MNARGAARRTGHFKIAADSLVFLRRTHIIAGVQRQRFLAILVAACVVSSVGSAAADAPAYTLFDLGTLGGTSSYATGLSFSTQVAGYSHVTDNAGQQAFITGSDGQMRSLGTLGGTNSSAFAINSSGRIAGAAQIAGDGGYHAFLSYAGGGSLVDLGTLGGTNSYAYGLNNAGVVVGYSLVSGNLVTHAFISAGSGLRDLGTLPGGTNSFAAGVNTQGQVTGYSGTASGNNHAFLSAPNGGALRDLGTLGGRYSLATAVNSSGQVVGRSELASIGVHAFLSAPNGGLLTDLGTLGGYQSRANGINDLGAVIGASLLFDNTTLHAFLYDGAAGMLDLNSLLVPGTGWSLTEAFSINDLGQIVGYGAVAGETHAFLMSPPGAPLPAGGLLHLVVVPEPTTVSLLLLSALTVAAVRRKYHKRASK